MDDQRMFYVVRLGEAYVKTIRYLEGGTADWQSIEVTLTTNSIDAAKNQTEENALNVARSIGGEVCCFGIYDAEPKEKQDPVEALFTGTRSSGHQFDWALRQMKSGNRVYREDWNDDLSPRCVKAGGVWITIQVPDDKHPMDLPFIYMRTITGSLIPWVATQRDMLHHDWCAVED